MDQVNYGMPESDISDFTEAEIIIQSHTKEVLKFQDIRPLSLLREMVTQWTCSKILSGAKINFKRSHRFANRK